MGTVEGIFSTTSNVSPTSSPCYRLTQVFPDLCHSRARRNPVSTSPRNVQIATNPDFKKLAPQNYHPKHSEGSLSEILRGVYPACASAAGTGERSRRAAQKQNFRPVSDTRRSPSFRARLQAATRNPGASGFCCHALRFKVHLTRDSSSICGSLTTSVKVGIGETYTELHSQRDQPLPFTSSATLFCAAL